MSMKYRRTKRSQERAAKRLARLGAKAAKTFDERQAAQDEAMDPVLEEMELKERGLSETPEQSVERELANAEATEPALKEMEERLAAKMVQRPELPELEEPDTSLRGRAAMRDAMATNGMNAVKTDRAMKETGFDYDKEQSWSGAGGYKYTYIPGDAGKMGHIEIEGTRPEGSIKPGRIVRVGPRFGDMDAFSAIMNEKMGQDMQDVDMSRSGTASMGGIVEEPQPPSPEGRSDQETGPASVDVASDEIDMSRSGPPQEVAEDMQDVDMSRSGPPQEVAEDRDIDVSRSGPPQEVNREETKEQARAMFTEALEAARDGNYEEALQKFMDSYEQEPHPDTLFNIAMAYNDLGMKDKAGEFFQKAARMTANQIIEDSRMTANQIMKDSKPNLFIDKSRVQ